MQNQIIGENTHIRRAKEADIEGILKLLVQVDMVHHNGRPDLFKGTATKYNARQLREILKNEETPQRDRSWAMPFAYVNRS